jgi:hypothetical protein
MPVLQYAECSWHACQALDVLRVIAEVTRLVVDP